MSTLLAGRNGVTTIDGQGSVLIANDSRVQLESLRHLISSAGFDVTVAEDGVEALEAAKAQLPDLIISDVVMPGMGGVELCRRIKADAVTTDIPVLLLTALRYDDAGVLEGLDAGADDYLQLDAPPSLLQKKTERLVAGSRERKARKQAEQALTENEERFRLLIENANDIITLMEPGGRILYISPTVKRLLGYDAAALVGRNVFEFVPADDLAKTKQAVSNLIAFCEVPQAIEHRLIAGDGTFRWFETNAVNMLNEPTIRGVIVSSRDIAERRKSEERYRAVVDQSANCILLVDVESRRIIDANPAAMRLFGYTRDELLGLTLYDLVADERAGIDANIEDVVATGSHFIGDRRYRTKDGLELDFEVTANTISYGDRTVLCVVALDLTDQKKMQRALMDSEERFRDLFENANDIVYTLDVHGKFTSVNKSAAQLAGYPREKLLGMRWDQLVPPDQTGDQTGERRDLRLSRMLV
ncbi:MAG TPA: PAS domain S-box protein, partial [Blastocatellia bacterium]|nr:PAS domain S-box protein [Blastocatellia bacterium]